MKKIIALFFVIMLFPFCARAENIRDQVDAPETVETILSSNSGKTVITMDAAVHVPDADSAFQIPVTPISFDYALVPVLAELMWPGLGDETPEIREDDVYATNDTQPNPLYIKHSASIWKHSTAQEDVNIGVTTFYNTLPGSEKPYAASLQSHVDYGITMRQNDHVNYFGFFFPGMRDSIGGHPLSTSDALDIANGFLQTITDEPFELFEMGMAQGHSYGSDPLEGPEPLENDFSYTFIFTRVVDGIPLLYSGGGQTMRTFARDDLTVPPAGYEKIDMTLNREGKITQFNWMNPCNIGNQRQPVTLLPFETVFSIAKNAMPLKYQCWEHSGDIRLHVNRIDLGYMAVLQRNTLDFALTPVWCFYGSLNGLRGTEFLPILILNAVDGSVIDLQQGY